MKNSYSLKIIKLIKLIIPALLVFNNDLYVFLISHKVKKKRITIPLN